MIINKHLALQKENDFTYSLRITKIISQGAKTKIAKRLMMKRTIEKYFPALANAIVAENQNKRDYATLVAAIRKQPAVKMKPHPGITEILPDGKKILNVVDASGYNHILLVDLDSAKNNDLIQVLGVFTSSASPYKGIYPTLVSMTRLDLKPQKQYLHKFENTFISKSAIKVQMNATLVLEEPDFVKTLNTIKVEQNLN